MSKLQLYNSFLDVFFRLYLCLSVMCIILPSLGISIKSCSPDIPPETICVFLGVITSEIL